MTSKTIEIIVATDGRTSVQTLGFTGPSCRVASKFIEEALGERIAENRMADFYQAQAVDQQQQQQA